MQPRRQMSDTGLGRIPSSDWIHLLIVFAGAFAVYAWSAPRTLAFEDDGLFVMASYFNGIAHPPGYPVFTLLGHLATYIPVGGIAYRIHLVSALFGALSCIVMYGIGMHLFRDRVYAYTAAFCLAFSRVFWSQAIISEVYTLNVFIFLLLVLLSLYQADESRAFSRRRFYLMALLYGLGLSNHWPLLVLSTPALMLILWPVRWPVIRALPYAVPWLVLGLMPYLWLVVRSHMDPVVSFYGPIESWQEFWHMVSRQGYAKTDVNVGADLSDKLSFAGFVVRETAVQFGPPGILLAAAGFIRQWYVWKLPLCLALLLAYLGSTFVLIGLLGFNYDVLHQNVFRVYPINAYSIMAIWICLGIRYLAGLAGSYKHIHAGTATVGKVLGGLLIGTALLSNIPYNYRAADRLAEEYAHLVLETLDENAVFITIGDIDTFTLGYFNLVEGKRPDITLYHNLGLVFSNRLFEPITTNEEERYDALKEFIEQETRPIYYLDDIPRLYGYQFYGPYSRVTKRLDKGEVEMVIDVKIVNFYERVLDSGEPYDAWERMVQRSMITDYCKMLSLYEVEEPERKQEHIDELLRVCRNYGGLLDMVDVMLAWETPDYNLIGELLERAEKLRGNAQTLKDDIKLDILYGRFLLQRDRRSAALQHFRRAIEEWPDPANPGYRLMQENVPSPDDPPAGEN